MAEYGEETGCAVFSKDGTPFSTTHSVIEPIIGHGVCIEAGNVTSNVLLNLGSGVKADGTASVVGNVVFNSTEARTAGRGLRPRSRPAVRPHTPRLAHLRVLVLPDLAIQRPLFWQVSPSLAYSQFDACFKLSSSSVTLTDNACAGAGSSGIAATDGYTVPPERFARNSVHSALVGFSLSGHPTELIQDVTLWQISLVGVWGRTTGSERVNMSDFRFVDCRYGFVWMGNNGPAATENEVGSLMTVELSDSLFVGRSQSNPYCGDQAAILSSYFAEGGGPSISPATCGPLGGEWLQGNYGSKHTVGSDPVIAAEVRMTANTFARFETSDGMCGASRVFEVSYNGGMEMADAVHPTFFKQTTIDADSQVASLAKPALVPCSPSLTSSSPPLSSTPPTSAARRPTSPTCPTRSTTGSRSPSASR